MIRKHFPGFLYEQIGRFRWCCADKSYLPLVHKISEDYSTLLLENSASRHSHISFKYDHPFPCPAPVFIKIQNVRHMKQKIKETLGLRHRYYGRRFGIAECKNLRTAKKADIPCPNIYAVGEARKGMLIDSYVVILEYLSGYRTLSDALLEATTDSEKKILLNKTASVVFDLYNKGMFHNDFSSKNLMFPVSGENAYRIVDFEYVRFVPRPSPILPAFQLGYLYKKWCKDVMEEKMFDDWAYGLLVRLASSNDFRSTKELYLQAKSGYFSRKDIISLVDSL